MYDLKQYKKLAKKWKGMPRKLPNYILSNFYKNSVKVRSKPIFIQIEPTNKCNLRCKMCALRSGLFNGRIGEMSLGNFKKIIDKFPETMALMLQGLGEPFLNKDFLKMVEYSNKRNIVTITTTNGTLLTNEKIRRRSVESGLSTMSISIDGATKKTYENVRIGASFDQVINNVKNLVEVRNRTKSDMSVYITGVLMKNNIEELPLFVELAHELGVDSLNFQSINIGNEYPIDFTKPQKIQESNSEFSQILNETLDKARDFNLKLRLPSNDPVYCDWLWKRVYITWDGYVTPCCGVVNFLMGNILEQEFDEIWNGKIYTKMREMLLKGKVPRPCVNCNLIQQIPS